MPPETFSAPGEGRQNSPPPAHGSRMENQGLSELTRHFCRGEATRHLSRGTFQQGRVNRQPACPPRDCPGQGPPQGRSRCRELQTCDSCGSKPRVPQPRTPQPHAEVTGRPRGAGVLPQSSPQAGWLPSCARRQLPLEKGTAAGRGPRPTRCPRQPRHTQRRGPATPGVGLVGRTIAPFTGTEVGVSPAGPQGAPHAGQPRKSRGEERQRASPRRRQGEPVCNTRQRATLARGQRAWQRQPVPRILFFLPSPGTGSLGQAASCPAASVSPAPESWQGCRRHGRAGGGQPWGEPSPVSRLLLATRGANPSRHEAPASRLASGPAAWGQERGRERGFVWGRATCRELPRWHSPSSGPHIQQAENNPKKGQPSHPGGTGCCLGTASPVCEDTGCWWSSVQPVPSFAAGCHPAARAHAWVSWQCHRAIAPAEAVPAAEHRPQVPHPTPGHGAPGATASPCIPPGPRGPSSANPMASSVHGVPGSRTRAEPAALRRA